MPFADDYTIPLAAMFIAATDPSVTHTDGRVKAGRLWLDTSTGDTGTLKKRNAANDGWDTLIDFDGATPATHAASHENGGSDEISVAGLSGLLADGQTPLAHKTSHQSGGSDAIKLDDLAAPDDNTDLNASTSSHGLLPKLSNSAASFLNGQGNWATPAGAGDVAGPGSSTDNAVARFDSTTGKIIQNSNLTVPDDAASTEVGYLNIPQNSQSANYTAVLADRGWHLLHPASDNNPRTFTIPANASVAFPVGTAITFVNKINTLTIAITTDTLTWSEDGSTGSRTLAANGMVTALKIASTEWLISGTGLS